MKVVHDGQVVVILKRHLSWHEGLGAWVARYRELGLTAYGPEKQDASDSLARMFTRFVQEYRKRGTLHDRLDKAGVTWCLREEYNGLLKHEDDEPNDEGVRLQAVAA